MSTTTARLNALETAVAAQGEVLTAILAELRSDKPAKVTRPKAAKAKATKRTAKPVTQPKAVRHLCRKNRADFVKAHPWAKGLSTQVIASMSVEDPSLLKRGWAIGERYTEMFSA